MQRALSIRRRVLGKRDPRYADGLVTLGKLVRDRGDFAGAEPLLELGLDAFRETLGERNPATAEAIKALGLLRLERGRYPQAEALLRRAAALEEPLLGAQSPLYLRALYGLAMSQVKQGRTRDARQSVNDIILQNELAMEREDPTSFADRIAELAESPAAALGDWVGAKRLYERCLEILPPETRLSSSASEPLDGMSRRLDVMSRLSALLRAMGDIVQAKAMLERVIEIQQADRRDPMNPFSRSGSQGGDTEDARELSRRHPSYARRLQDLAELLLDLGDHQRATPLLQQSLSLTEELLGTDHPDCALRLSGLAPGAVTASGDLEKKDRRPGCGALDQSRRAWGEGHPVTLRALNNLAEIHIARGELDLARPLLERSVAGNYEQKESHPDEVAVLANLSEVLILQRDFARSRVLLDRAMTSTRFLLGEDHPGAARVLDLLSSWHLAQGNIEDARRQLDRSVDLNERYLTQYLPVLAERERIALMSTFRKALSRLLSLPGDDRVATQLYQRLVAWKGISASGGATSSVPVDRTSTPGVDLQALRQELERVRSSITYLYQRRDAETEFSEERTETTAREFRDAVERCGQLESQLARVSGWKLQPLTTEQVAVAVPKGTALVDVFRYTRHRLDPGPLTARSEPQYVAFVLRNGAGPNRIELGPAAQIDSCINRWRKQLEAADTEADATGTELARLVWTPLVSALGAVSTVIIAPDGDLNFLPWAALPDASSRSYLIERFAFGTVLSARQLVEPGDGSTEPASGELLAVGGVDYGKAEPAVTSKPAPRAEVAGRAPPVAARNLGFDPLPATLAEVEAIARLFQETGHGDVQTLSGPRATKRRVLGAMTGKRYLHLATHGYFAPPETASAMAPGSREIALRPFEGIVPSEAAGFYPSLLGLGLGWRRRSSPERVHRCDRL